jgi:hypothetical protein
MELVLLLPDKKPPFVGVLYAEKDKRAYLNHDLIHVHGDIAFNLLFEAMQQHVNIQISCEPVKIMRNYTHLKYDPQLLKEWLNGVQVSKATYIVFSQLIQKNGKMEPIKTQYANKPFRLVIQNCQLLSSYKKQSAAFQQSGSRNDWNKL